MRALSLLGLVLLLAFVGCGDSNTAPALPQQLSEGALDGNWETANVASGAGKILALTSSGGSIAGAGQDFDDQHQIIGSYTITGTYVNTDITLSMSYDDGSSATFDASVMGTDTIQGTWTGPNGGQITLFRVS